VEFYKSLAGLSFNQERIISIPEYKKIEIITREELIDLIKKFTKIKRRLLYQFV